MEHEVSDRNEWFKDVKRLIRGLEVETKALLVGLFDRTFTCLDHRISSTDEDAGPTRRPVAVVMRRDGRLREVDPWRVVIDDSEEVFEMYSWMWDEESVMCEQLGLAEVKAEKGGDE